MENLTYENAAKELEDILQLLKTDSVSIDELAEKVERAAQLLKFCTDKLRVTEQKVNEIIQKVGL